MFRYNINMHETTREIIFSAQYGIVIGLAL
jgi:hypothetical protein